MKEILGNFLEYIQFHKIPANVLMREIHPLGLVPYSIIMNALAYQVKNLDDLFPVFFLILLICENYCKYSRLIRKALILVNCHRIRIVFVEIAAIVDVQCPCRALWIRTVPILP